MFINFYVVITTHSTLQYIQTFHKSKQSYSETSEQRTLCPLLRDVRYWEVILKRLSHLGLKVLFAIQGMCVIWDVHYQKVSPYFFPATITLRFTMYCCCFCSVLYKLYFLQKTVSGKLLKTIPVDTLGLAILLTNDKRNNLSYKVSHLDATVMRKQYVRILYIQFSVWFLIFCL